MRPIIRVALAVAAMLAAAAVHPQTAPPPLDAAARSVIVESAAKELRDRYIYPEVGDHAAAAIEAALAAGTYDDLAEPWAFATALTTELAEVTNDRHLRIFARGPAPAPSDASAAPPSVPPPRSEAGVVRADRLPDNVGYLEISAFPALDAFRPPLDRAMAALADTRALIIDARRHGGGGADAEAYLASYFLEAGSEPVSVNRFVWRNPGTNTFRTQDFLSSPTPFSYAGKPVYILTSERTFSGGEAIAYDMRALGLAVLVGEVTGGGAHPGGTVPLGTDFAIWVPSGRGENAITGTNWEGMGVTPDVPAPAAEALQVALAELGVSTTQTEIDTLSEASLFEPRSTPHPDSEATVRRLIGELAQGEPNYDLMSEGLAQVTRDQLERLHEFVAPLGDIQSIAFREVDMQGADVYEVTFANGDGLLWMVVLDEEGKTTRAAFRQL